MQEILQQVQAESNISWQSQHHSIFSG